MRIRRFAKRLIALLMVFFFFLTSNVIANEFIDEIKDTIRGNYLYNFDETKFDGSNIKESIKNLGDIYSEYFFADEFDNYLETLNGGYVGIGVSLEKGEYGILITGVFENSSAKQSGILPGDIIVEVDGVDVKNKSLEDVIVSIRGKEGTYVKLKIKRKSDLLEYNLKRTKISTTTVRGQIINGHIGYISLFSFEENTNTEFLNVYNSLKSKGADIFILDVRNNGGGFIDSAVKVLSNFIGNNNSVILTDKNGIQTKIKSDVVPSKLINDRFILLTNENSVGSTEIIAAALKDYNKALIIGNKTYGKGTLQDYFELSNGDVIKLTTHKLYSPYGKEINKVGVLPHIYIENDIYEVAMQLTEKEPALDKTNYVKFIINGKNYYVYLNDEIHFNKLMSVISNCDMYIGVKNNWIKKDLNYYKQKENPFIEIKKDISNLLLELQKREIEQKKKEQEKNNIQNNQSNTILQNKIVTKKYGYVSISRLNFRQLPSKKSKILFVLKRNTKVDILGSINGWYIISYKYKLAYVYGKYIKIAK
ncbi:MULTISPECIES: S41 family peptidase [Caloramator]|uniref:Carboxyl-terminal processing protease n=1 Tax=Caloramator proteoclasticus DSM 10124 TaxID=1121262 RepID=A0A1M4S6M9_9CLOT|nr:MULTISPECIES: S41 family peptidase [Caloramator]SHE27841.1 carboxyl-terminal processing protease [Caloramator proteoclasticus DSM 10124]